MKDFPPRIFEIYQKHQVFGAIFAVIFSAYTILAFFQNQIATLSIIHSEITGTIFKEPTTKIVNSGLGFAGWQLKNNAFKLKEFLNSAINFKSVMSINKWQYGNPKVGDLVITSEGTDQMLVSEIIAIDPSNNFFSRLN